MVGVEILSMKCHVCGSELVSTVTDLPFRLNDTTIVTLKDLPVLQCSGCSEYLLEDVVMERVVEILGRSETGAWQNFISETYGSMAESPIERGLQEELEVREPFDDPPSRSGGATPV
ncbi:MAG TPA: YgiT-type zinc finger protein [Thermoanaerobaculia bacterium]|nr:YgiT-type zinc finger protein [Thermoanaerobaculia bacterium]